MAVRDETLDRKTGEIVARVKAGEAVYMYRSLYLPVDSTVSGDGLDLNLPSSFNLGPLPNLGCDGWDVVTAIPRTLGLGLTNMSLGSAVGSTWGAGIGGIVVGVHLVLRRSFSLASDEDMRAEVREYLRANLESVLSDSDRRELLSHQRAEDAARFARETQEAAQRQAEREASMREEMDRYGITFDGEKYIYGQYKYARLEDALNYAKQQAD